MNVDIKKVAEALQERGREVYVISSGGDKKFHFSMRKEDKSYFCTLWGGQYLSLNDLKLLGDTLLALHKELENRKKIRNGETYFYVSFHGLIFSDTFYNTTLDLSRLLSGNAFKTREDAEAARESILLKLRKVREQLIIEGDE